MLFAMRVVGWVAKRVLTRPYLSTDNILYAITHIQQPVLIKVRNAHLSTLRSWLVRRSLLPSLSRELAQTDPQPWLPPPEALQVCWPRTATVIQCGAGDPSLCSYRSSQFFLFQNSFLDIAMWNITPKCLFFKNEYTIEILKRGSY